MEKVSLSVELVNAVLNYLGNQKFVEVAGLITRIQAEGGPQAQPAPAETAEVSE